MASSTSSGRISNTDMPRELRGRMEWDPEFRSRHQQAYPQSESDDDDGGRSGDEYSLGPYVSGGLQVNGNTPSEVSTQANEITSTNLNPNGGSHDGFQRVSYGRSSKSKPNTKGKPPHQPRKPRSVNLVFKRDNPAKAAFRERDPPTGQFDLKKDCHEVEPSRKKMYNFLEELGVRQNVYIRPPQHDHDRILLLWGTKDQIERTKQDLQEWLRPTRSMIDSIPKPRAKFVKDYSNISDKYRRDQGKIRKKAEIQRFQQNPEADVVFAYRGVFLWPAEEVAPTELLGGGLEALDPVRTKHQCHIVFDAQRSEFKVLANKLDSVKKTLPRFNGIMKEYVARIDRPITRYYIDPPSPYTYRHNVKTLPSLSFGSGAGASKIPLLTGKTLETGECEEWIRMSTDLIAQSNRGIEEALRKTISNLPFHRGQVRMRVHFGTFALTLFRWPGTADSIPFDDFIKNIAISRTKGTMIRDLLIKDAATIMGKVHKASKLFQPIDNTLESLVDVTPSFSACFEFRHEKVPLKFEVEWATNAAWTDKIFAQWTRLERRATATPLQIFMIRLDGAPSWKLQTSTENVIDVSRVTPKMVEFAASIKLKKTFATKIELTGRKVFEWDKRPGSMGMRITSFQQKTSLKYRLVRNMEYMIEISRYDTYGDPENESQSVQTNWGATLWNTDWDSELMANERLDIGESAVWDARLGTFFPSILGAQTNHGEVNPGVMEFLQIVREVNDFLDDIKKELRHLRG